MILPSVDIGQNLETFLVVTVGKGTGQTPGVWWVETRETDYTPYHAQGSPRDTQLLAVNINSTDRNPTAW